MKILFIADGRSPTAINWISHFASRGDSVHLVSMFACRPTVKLASLTIIPVVFSGAAAMGGRGSPVDTHRGRLPGRLLRVLATPEIRTWLRHRFVPQSLKSAAEELSSMITRLDPDLVHAMRIPYEGMLGSLAFSALTGPKPPFVVSVWGNDFSLHAPTTRRMATLTRQTMRAAAALHTDCAKDQRLATMWGFEKGRPAIVLPGAGGIQLETFYGDDGPRDPVVINPRGLRSYVRNDTFFSSIPLVLAQKPDTRFICPAMAGQPEAQRWVQDLGIEDAVDLLPLQPRDQMAVLYRQSRVVVSPSTHDGTPNTILEAMACGCTPVAGDIESLREWITPGVNGLLVDPADPQALSAGIVEALENDGLAARARDHNRDLIRERAAYDSVMETAAAFYNRLVAGG